MSSKILGLVGNYIGLLDYSLFCEHHLGFRPYPEQLQISSSFDKESYLLVLMARQSGKSWTISSKLLHYSLTNSDKRILIFAPSKQQAVDILFGRIHNWIDRSPFLKSFVKSNSQGILMLYNDHLELKNGTTIRCLSASDRSNVVGFTGDVVVLDESQDISDMVVYRKIEPMLGSIKNPKYVKVGTPRGVGNHFYESWRLGKEGKLWHVEEYPWQKCSNLNRRTIELYRRTNPHFATEYELKWMNNIEAFFSREELDDLFIDYDIDDYHRKFEEGRGNKIYKELYCGIDWAKVNDSTVVSFVANEGGRLRLVGVYELQGDYRTQIRDIYRLLGLYSPLVTYMDATGSTSQALSDMLSGKGHYIEPVIMTNKYKSTILYDTLKRIVNYRMLELPVIEKMQKQFYDLQITHVSGSNLYDKISHPSGGHDDYPDSIALACLGFRELVDSRMERLAYRDSGKDPPIDHEIVIGINTREGGETTSEDHSRGGLIDLL